MAVYINGYVAEFAKNIGYRTAYSLGQTTELPYFNAFEQPLLTLPELYQQIDKQISAILAQTGWQRDELSSIPILLGSSIQDLILNVSIFWEIILHIQPNEEKNTSTLTQLPQHHLFWL